MQFTTIHKVLIKTLGDKPETLAYIWHYIHITYIPSNTDALTSSLISNLAPLMIRNSTISNWLWDAAMSKAVRPIYIIAYTSSVND